MPLLKPDPTFYPSPRMAAQGPAEKLAYVAALNPPANRNNDAMLVVDVDPGSSTYSQEVGRCTLTNFGDELHHFGWNACSSALCPYAPHPHVERRYLVVPGIRSSRLYVIDIKPDSRKPQIVRTIEPEEVAKRAGYSRPHTVHCGPEGIYVSALGSPSGDGPGGIFLLDHFSFDVLGQWEVDRGDQYLHYDFWWHLLHDTLLSTEWATPKMIENGLQPDLLMKSEYGHRMHVWDLRRRRITKTLDLGKEYQMVLEMRPAHDPTKTYGFAGVVVSLKDLSASIWLWQQQADGSYDARKVITIPPEPADPDQLPDALKPFSAWINGRKRFQGGVRADIPVVEQDGVRLKFNPFANSSRDEIEAIYKLANLPPHPLVASGFMSVGCMPCTSRTSPDEDARAGRWRGRPKTECGIHTTKTS